MMLVVEGVWGSDGGDLVIYRTIMLLGIDNIRMIIVAQIGEIGYYCNYL